MSELPVIREPGDPGTMRRRQPREADQFSVEIGA